MLLTCRFFHADFYIHLLQLQGKKRKKELFFIFFILSFVLIEIHTKRKKKEILLGFSCILFKKLHNAKQAFFKLLSMVKKSQWISFVLKAIIKKQV
jgi:hypothetical protein